MSESYVSKFAFLDAEDGNPSPEQVLAVVAAAVPVNVPGIDLIPQEISTVEEADELVELRIALMERAKKMHEEFDCHVNRAHLTHKGLVAQRSRHLQPIERALTAIRSVVGAYQQKLRAIEAEARAKAESERRKAEAKLRAKLERKGVERNEAAAAAQAAAAAAKPAPPPERKPTGFGGTRKGKITIRVTNMKALVKAVAGDDVPLKVLKVDESALRDYFRLHDGGSPPGVTMTQEIIAV